MYTIEEGINGFPNATHKYIDRRDPDPIGTLNSDPLVSDQTFINNNGNMHFYHDISEDNFAPSSKDTITMVLKRLEEIHEKIGETNIIYAKNNSTHARTMEEIIENVKEMIEIKNKMKNEYLNEISKEITTYNDHLQAARAELIQTALRRLAKNFNDNQLAYATDFKNELSQRRVEINNAAIDRFKQKAYEMKAAGCTEEEYKEFKRNYYDNATRTNPATSKYYHSWTDDEVAKYDSKFANEKTECGGYIHQLKNGEWVLMINYQYAAQIQYDTGWISWWNSKKYDPSADQIMQNIESAKKLHKRQKVNDLLDDKFKPETIKRIASSYEKERAGVENA